MKKIALLTLISIAFFTGCKDNEIKNLPDGIYAEITTNRGTIIASLEYEKAPVTVANFITLAEGTNQFVTYGELKGKQFYKGLRFYRVVSEFMVQTGAPSEDGTADAGYTFKDEFTDLSFNKGGMLAMANNGTDTNCSQFFITHNETPWLDGKHTIFGRVVGSGMKTVNKIIVGDYIDKIKIIRKGANAKSFNAVKVFSDYMSDKDISNSQLSENSLNFLLRKKSNYFNQQREKATKTKSGLRYNITSKTGKEKPKKGAKIGIRYAGYFENGALFDSNIPKILKSYGKFDEVRNSQNGYQPLKFEIGAKDGLIPGFIEGIEQMSFGDKAIIFIPSALGYGSAGAGDVIPPNTNLVFELELIPFEIK